jgi:molybdopterin synthase catalytic subunit
VDQPIIKIEVRQEDFDLNREVTELTADRCDLGAVVSFSGLCRDENGTLAALEIEHYPGMAEIEIKRIAEIACERWPLGGLVAIHRFGKFAPGENIVLVIAVSKHRQAAFDGANYIMDFLKTRAPFWKKEHLKDGSAGQWVSAKHGDDDALVKWDAN